MKADKRIDNLEEVMKAISILLEQHRAEIDSQKRAFIYYDKALSQVHEEVRTCRKILQEQQAKRWNE